jgi:hypothetical protein
MVGQGVGHVSGHHVVVVRGRPRTYAFGPFKTAEQATDYATTWLPHASYQIVPLTKPIVEQASDETTDDSDNNGVGPRGPR